MQHQIIQIQLQQIVQVVVAQIAHAVDEVFPAQSVVVVLFVAEVEVEAAISNLL
jgi:hypothetical protein